MVGLSRCGGPAFGRDIALRCPRPRPAGGSNHARRTDPILLHVAPLYAAPDGAARRPYHIGLRALRLTSPAPIIIPVPIPSRKSLPHEIPLWVDPQREIYFITINCQVRGTNQLATDNISTALFETIRHRQEQGLWWPHVFLLMPDHLHALLSFPPSVAPLHAALGHLSEMSLPQRQVGMARRAVPARVQRAERNARDMRTTPSVAPLNAAPGHLGEMSLPQNQVGMAPRAVPARTGRAEWTLRNIVTSWKRWTARQLGIRWQRDFFEHRLRREESRREKADYILDNPVRKKLAARPEDWPFVYFADGQRPDFPD